MISPQRVFVLLGIAALLSAAAILSLDGMAQQAASAAGISLICLAAMLMLLRSGHRLARFQSQKAVSHFITNDSAHA